MSKLLIGVAIGYLLSDVIDEFLGKNAPKKVSLKEDPLESTPPPTMESQP